MDYILTYDGSTTKVLSNGFMFTSTEKPKLSFSFDVLIYETPTKNAFKVLDDVKIDLTEEEVTECNTYCSKYSTVSDYLVSAYDNDGVYQGDMLKSVTIAYGYKYILFDTPDNPVVKRVDNLWVPIYAIIKEDGSYILNPPSICSSCVLFYTKEEWDALPSKPLRPTDSYDFVTEEFKDIRVTSTLAYTTSTDIRNHFEALRWQVWDKFIPQYEQMTWQAQVREAELYFSNSNTETVYTDTYLGSLGSEAPTKEEFLIKVMENNRDYLVKMASVSAQQEYWLVRVKKATTNEELDIIIKDLETFKAQLQTRPIVEEV